ncbi:hypothetical protein [Kineococcus aurantiacus]|uniref:Uncharacterized protein n=1 Tax=Kineococcus aurantiacus TaxID=37633 RepID=A0A7Y9DIK5_9ACTN|nr:hypothetical protein [Kineococcus aurantiacus]NYD20519.1 hypothetical protein [Kineococcus aurantiacus]
MWVLLSGGLRRWLIASLAVPVAAKVLGAAGRRLEARNGPSTLSRGLRGAGRLVSRDQREEHAATQRRSMRRWNR